MGFFIYIGGSKYLDCICWVVYCSLGTVLVIRYVISIIFANSMALFRFKKGEFGTFR